MLSDWAPPTTPAPIPVQVPGHRMGPEETFSGRDLRMDRRGKLGRAWVWMGGGQQLGLNLKFTF